MSTFEERLRSARKNFDEQIDDHFTDQVAQGGALQAIRLKKEQAEARKVELYPEVVDQMRRDAWEASGHLPNNSEDNHHVPKEAARAAGQVERKYWVVAARDLTKEELEENKAVLLRRNRKMKSWVKSTLLGDDGELYSYVSPGEVYINGYRIKNNPVECARETLQADIGFSDIGYISPADDHDLLDINAVNVAQLEAPEGGVAPVIDQWRAQLIGLMDVNNYVTTTTTTPTVGPAAKQPNAGTTTP